jgi:hypothetical protein
MQIKTSVKHMQISKANNLMFIVVAAASVLVVFSLASTKTLMSVSSYQHRALKAKKLAADKLQKNVKEAEALKKQYDTFEDQNPNIIGGVGGLDVAEAIAKQGEQAGTLQVNGKTISLTGQDGDNAKIVLDALPSSYDFPALISSIEKIANLDHLPLQGVGGTDQSDAAANPAAPTSSSSTSSRAVASAASSQSIPIPFSIGAQTDYSTIQALVKDLERSIRPVDITTFALNGNGGQMNVSMQASTSYQLPISLNITEKKVQ